MSNVSEKVGRRGNSGFLKLLLVYLGTVLVVVALVLGFLEAIVSTGKADGTSLDRNRAMYAHLLEEKLGTPPRLGNAQALSDSLSIEVRLEGATGSWSTWEGLPEFSPLRWCAVG